MGTDEDMAQSDLAFFEYALPSAAGSQVLSRHQGLGEGCRRVQHGGMQESSCTEQPFAAETLVNRCRYLHVLAYLHSSLVTGQGILLPVGHLRVVKGTAQIRQGIGNFYPDCVGYGHSSKSPWSSLF